METTQQNISWDEVQPKTMTPFVKFAGTDKRTGLPIKEVFAITNWRLFWSEERDFNDKTKLVKKIKFQADVVGRDGKQTQEKISNASTRFINAIKPLLVDKDTKSIVFISVKKIGEGAGTQYDIECVQPTVLQ